MLTEHPSGGYFFLPGIAPYSCGVVSAPGHEIVHVTFLQPPAYRIGFDRVDDLLQSEGRPRTALCAISLRSPRPYSFAGFGAFNAEYADILKAWGVFVGGVNPIARTNVAPVVAPPAEPVLYGFAFTRPCSEERRRTFVVAGAGELPEGVLQREGIVALGDVTRAGLERKARFVMDLMTARLRGLGCDWPSVTTINTYTAHSLTDVLSAIVLAPVGRAALRGVAWHYSRPPIDEIEYEMDIRGTHTEWALE